MPTGTGKTVCLLSLILSFIKQKQPTFKLVYCTRTIVEMEKTLEELKFVQQRRKEDFGRSEETKHLCSDFLALCLSSRRNLCIHPSVMQEDDREKVDSMCRALTAHWVQGKDEEKKAEGKTKRVKDIEEFGTRCKYYDTFE